MKAVDLSTDKFKVLPQQEVLLHKFDPNFHDGYKNKKEAEKQLMQDIELLSQLQYQLYAENKSTQVPEFRCVN